MEKTSRTTEGYCNCEAESQLGGQSARCHPQRMRTPLKRVLAEKELAVDILDEVGKGRFRARPAPVQFTWR